MAKAKAPSCRNITVVTFRGDRSRAFAASFLQALEDEKNNRKGPKPTALDCLLYAGHTGVSVNDSITIYGFNPDGGRLPFWRLLDQLKNGDAFSGVVCDDTAVFAEARKRKLAVVSFDVVFPDCRFQEFQQRLDSERRQSQYSYGFPNGDGDCNCITWLERLGLPLLTGRMNEFIGLSKIVSIPSRRFGKCI